MGLTLGVVWIGGNGNQLLEALVRGELNIPSSKNVRLQKDSGSLSPPAPSCTVLANSVTRPHEELATELGHGRAEDCRLSGQGC